MKKVLLFLITFLLFLPILLFTQETFEFDQFPSNATAGDSFYVHITCTSTPDFFGVCRLSIIPVPGDPEEYNPMRPDTAVLFFNAGEWEGYITVFMASDSLHINCTQIGDIGTSLSPQLDVDPNLPERLRILLPGQNARPGDTTSRGRNDIYYVNIANVSFNVNISAADHWWNPVGYGQDTVHLSTNNLFPVLPPDAMLSGGNVDLNVRLRTAMNACTLFVEEVTQENSLLLPDTSSRIRVIPDAFAKLLLIAPGMDVLPGDTTTDISLLPGATPNAAEWQVAGTPFEVKAYAVDDYWNPVGISAPQDNIRIFGTIGNQTVVDTGILTSGLVVFTITANISNWLYLEANDIDNSSITTQYKLPIYIAGAHYRVEADEENDTIISGDPIHLHIYYEDENEEIITGFDHNIKIYAYGGAGSLTPTDTIVRSLVAGRSDPIVYYVTIREEDLYLEVASADTLRKTNPGRNVNPIHVRANVTPTDPIVNFPNPFGADFKETTIYYWLGQPSDVDIAIYDRFGNLVRTWEKNGETGDNYLIWDGKNDRGKMVANGAYLLTVRASYRTEILKDYKRWIAVVK